jgi:hypothetical protein
MLWRIFTTILSNIWTLNRRISSWNNFLAIKTNTASTYQILVSVEASWSIVKQMDLRRNRLRIVHRRSTIKTWEVDQRIYSHWGACCWANKSLEDFAESWSNDKDQSYQANLPNVMQWIGHLRHKTNTLCIIHTASRVTSCIVCITRLFYVSFMLYRCHARFISLSQLLPVLDAHFVYKRSPSLPRE